MSLWVQATCQYESVGTGYMPVCSYLLQETENLLLDHIMSFEHILKTELSDIAYRLQ